MKYPTYPIYYASLWWPATSSGGERVIDCGGAHRMFRAQPTRDELQAWLDTLWAHCRSKQWMRAARRRRETKAERRPPQPTEGVG